MHHLGYRLCLQHHVIQLIWFAKENANMICDDLSDGTPSTLISIIGYKQYRRSARDMYYFLQVSKTQYPSILRSHDKTSFWLTLYITLWLQSNVCVKQLSYAMLEQVIVTIFPELRQLIDDIHEKGRKEQASFPYHLWAYPRDCLLERDAYHFEPASSALRLGREAETQNAFPRPKVGSRKHLVLNQTNYTPTMVCTDVNQKLCKLARPV